MLDFYFGIVYNSSMLVGYFFDLDGTLYNNRYHSVSPKIIEALWELKKRGNRLFVATSRTERELDHLPKDLREFPFDARILDGGSRIVSANGENLFFRPISSSMVEDIQSFCEDHELIWRYSTFHGNYWGAQPSFYEHHAYYDLYLCAPIYEEYTSKKQVLNILIFIEDGQDKNDFKKRIQDCSIIDFGQAMELREKTVDKIHAVKWCQDKFNLDSILCFGDGENDVEMIKGADVGICMGNGHPKLKKVADHVIQNVDQDGIYHFLKDSHKI